MAQLAVIDKATGEVINVIVGPPDFSDGHPGHLIVASDTAQIGWRFDGHGFQGPPIPQEHLMQVAQSKLEMASLGSIDDRRLYRLHKQLVQLTREKTAVFDAMDAEFKQIAARIESGELKTIEQIAAVIEHESRVPQ
jgi:hypothetical protein